MTPGIHAVTNDAYHSGPGVSKTGLWTIYRKTPAHFRFAAKRDIDPNVADFGTASHIAILEPERFYAAVVRGPADRRGNKWTDAKTAAATRGAIVLTESDHDKVCMIRDSADLSETVRSIRNGAIIETAGYAINPETGVLVKCKPDAYNPALGVMADIKTAQAGGRAEFQRAVVNYGYHMQEAFYTDVWEFAAEGTPHASPTGDKLVQGFVFIVIEKDAPHLVSCYELAPAAVEEGRAAYRKALRLYADCQRMEEAGVPSRVAWPGYSDDPTPLDIPRWGYVETSAPQMETMS